MEIGNEIANLLLKSITSLNESQQLQSGGLQARTGCDATPCPFGCDATPSYNLTEWYDSKIMSNMLKEMDNE